MKESLKAELVAPGRPVAEPMATEPAVDAAPPALEKPRAKASEPLGEELARYAAHDKALAANAEKAIRYAAQDDARRAAHDKALAAALKAREG